MNITSERDGCRCRFKLVMSVFDVGDAELLHGFDVGDAELLHGLRDRSSRTRQSSRRSALADMEAELCLIKQKVLSSLLLCEQRGG